MAKKALLMILDGWGEGPKGHSNAIYSTPTPYLDHLFANYPNSTLKACGEDAYHHKRRTQQQQKAGCCKSHACDHEHILSHFILLREIFSYDLFLKAVHKLPPILISVFIIAQIGEKVKCC